MQFCCFIVLVTVFLPLILSQEVENERLVKIQLGNEEGNESWCSCNPKNICQCFSPTNPNEILSCRPHEKKKVVSCLLSSCTCEESGNSWECSLGLCLPRRPRSVPVAVDLKNTPCAPNDYFQIDCNRCYCNIDKTGYLCTENICVYVDPPKNTTNITEITSKTGNSTEISINAGVTIGNQTYIANKTVEVNTTTEDHGGGDTTTTATTKI